MGVVLLEIIAESLKKQLVVRVFVCVQGRESFVSREAPGPNV